MLVFEGATLHDVRDDDAFSEDRRGCTMPTETANWVGAELAGGRYRVSMKLGEGGMGFVYRAWDKNLESDVVIKVPRPALQDDAEFAGRFAREIRALVRLSHPHIVKITDVGEHDRLSFAVMQFLSGGSLKDRQHIDASGRPTPARPEDLSKWLPAVASALDFVHQQGFIHRDVKPANILFDAHDNAFLSDFGIAKVLTGRPGSPGTGSITGTGMVLGTPEYMAPELIMAEPHDGRCDQYALAITVHELLSGRVPFEGAAPSAILVRHTSQEPPALHELDSSIPAGISSAVIKALSKKARHRFPDCASFASAVIEAVGESPVRGLRPHLATRGIGVQPGHYAVVSDEPIDLPCPVCGYTLHVTAQVAGRRVRCGSCKTKLQVAPNREQLSAAPEKAESGLPGGTTVIAVASPPRREEPVARGTTKSSQAGADTGSLRTVSRRSITSLPRTTWALQTWKIPALIVGVIVLSAGLAVAIRSVRGSKLADAVSTVGPNARDKPAAQPRPPTQSTPTSPPTDVAGGAEEKSETQATTGTVRALAKNSGTSKPVDSAANSATPPGGGLRTSTEKNAIIPKSSPTGTGTPARLAVTSPRELLEQVRPAPAGATGNELLHSQEIARLAYANLAIAATFLHDEAVHADAVTQMKSVAPTTKWEDVDKYFDSYSIALEKQSRLLGMPESIPDSLPKVQHHVVTTESYLRAVRNHFQQQLKDDPTLLQKLAEINRTAELEKWLAKSTLQEICQAHLRVCEILAAVLERHASNSPSASPALVDGIKNRNYATGLDQLRWLLYCELQLWTQLTDSNSEKR